jgi:hypothetical protein
VGAGAAGTGAAGTGGGDGVGGLSTGGTFPGSGGNAGGGAGGDAGYEDGGSDGSGGSPGACGNRVGTPTIDGFLQATDDIVAAAHRATSAFETALTNTESELGLNGSSLALRARVDAIVDLLSVDVSANTDGLWIYGARTECGSNVAVAQNAQLSCEVILCGGGNGVNAVEIPVECSGTCLGPCGGACSDTRGQLCVADVSGKSCDGLCEGTCELTAPGWCDGICAGTCSGTCTATDVSGCVGECNASCQGTCTPEELGGCEGLCTGRCLSSTSGECSGDVYCDSECLGECKGACGGTVIPEAGVPNCEHSADCQEQAGALSLAHLGCTPAALSHAFEYTGPGPNEAQFTLKMAKVIAELRTAEDSFNVLSALITGEVNGEVVYKPSPISGLTAGLNGLVTAGISGDLFSTVPEESLLCVLPALTEALQSLSDLVAESSSVLEAQARLIDEGRRGFE